MATPGLHGPKWTRTGYSGGMSLCLLLWRHRPRVRSRTRQCRPRRPTLIEKLGSCAAGCLTVSAEAPEPSARMGTKVGLPNALDGVSCSALLGGRRDQRSRHRCRRSTLTCDELDAPCWNIIVGRFSPRSMSWTTAPASGPVVSARDRKLCCKNRGEPGFLKRVIELASRPSVPNGPLAIEKPRPTGLTCGRPGTG